MDITDLPGLGPRFHLKLNKSGQPGLEKSLKKLARKNYEFRNLSAENVKDITDALKPYERRLRLGASLTGVKGLGRLSQKAVKHKLWGKYLGSRGLEEKNNAKAFTKADFADAKKIIKHLTVEEQRRLAEKAKTSHARVTPQLPLPDEIASGPRSVTSISDLTRPGRPNLSAPSPSTRPRPPRIGLVN